MLYPLTKDGMNSANIFSYFIDYQKFVYLSSFVSSILESVETRGIIWMK